jgi:hypothetical protein
MQQTLFVKAVTDPLIVPLRRPINMPSITKSPHTEIKKTKRIASTIHARNASFGQNHYRLRVPWPRSQ